MHLSFIAIIIMSAFAQSCSWMIRKKLLKMQQVDRKTVIVAESIIITSVLFTYIYFTSDVKQIYKGFFKISKEEYFYLFLVGLCVVGPLLGIFYLMNKIDISTLSPSLSILRIVMLTIFGWTLFGEKISIKKLVAIILMIFGVLLIMHEK